MTIRYVQTNVNKYIQARCMAQNFTTDVTQWQSVDDEPTAGSDNLIKSSGVAASLIDLNQLRGIISGQPVLFTNNNVPSGMQIYYHFVTNNGQSGVIDFYDDEDTLLLRIGKASTAGTTNEYQGKLNVPSDFSYCKAITSGTFQILYLYTQDSFLAHKQELQLLNDGYSKYVSNQNGHFYVEDNKVGYSDDNSNVCMSIDMQALKVGDIVYYYGRHSSAIITTDANGLVKRTIGHSTVGLYTLTLEADEAFVYFTAVKATEPYILIPNAACVIYNHIHYIQGKCNEYAIEQDEKMADKIYCLFKEKTFNNKDNLFYKTPYTNIGDKIYYDVESVSGGVGYIELLDENDTQLAYYGIPSSSSSVQHASGDFIIPSGFYRARIIAGTNKTATIHNLSSEKNIQEIFEKLNKVSANDKALSEFIGFDKQLFNSPSYSGGFRYLPVYVFVDDEIDYTLEIQFIGGTKEEGFKISGTKIQSSTDPDAFDIGRYTTDDIENQTIRKYTFRKLKGVPMNFIRFGNIGNNDSIILQYTINSGVKAKLDTLSIREKNIDWDNTCILDNRLSNPLFTSLAKYNQEHQSSPIVEETIFEKTTGITQIRIPISMITNAGTHLVAGTLSTSGPVEYGETSVWVARKDINSNVWTKTKVFDYEQYGQFWDNSFVIDRIGVNGTANRIYLFSGCGVGDGGALVTWDEVSYANADLLFVYSDDDGITWSQPTSLKSLWTADEYSVVLPAPNNGMQMTDGTLVVPMLMTDSVTHYSAIMYKKPNEDWVLTKHVPIIYQQGNECIAVEINTNVPTLYIRNELRNHYTIDDENYIKGINDQIYSYSITDDEWTKIDSTFNPVAPCQFSVIKVVWDNKTLFLRSALDTNSAARINITIWASLDGFRWLRIYRVYKPDAVGYSSVAEYNGDLIIAYETLGNAIKYQDITAIKNIIVNSLDKFFYQSISIQDRMQMLFNTLTGID